MNDVSNDGEPQRYTLSEARLALAQAECQRQGHDFLVIATFGGDPSRILCQRGCGVGPWPVMRKVANEK